MAEPKKKKSARRGKGDDSVYLCGDGFYRGAIDLGYVNGKRKRKTFKASTRAEILARMKKFRDELTAGIITDTVTTGEWMTHWLDVSCVERGLKPRTVYGYRRYVELYVIPTIGRVELRRLTVDHIRAVYTKMRDQGLSETTVRQCHSILSRALKVAEREARIRRNPCTLMDAPRPDGVPYDSLSTEEAKLVLKAARNTRELVRLTCALVLGLRQGEALGLRWEDIDLERNVLSVEVAASSVPGLGPFEQTPKSKASRREIPLPLQVAAVIDMWRKESGGIGLVFPPMDRHGVPRPGMKPQSASIDYRSWQAAITRANDYSLSVGGEGVHHVPLHGARASTASLLRDMRVPEHIIADILGHANPQTTRDHYLRHSSETERLEALEGSADRLDLRALGAGIGL